MERLSFAEHDQVHRARVAREQHQAAHGDQRDGQHRAPGRACEAAQRPEDDASQLGVVGEEAGETDQAARDRVHRDPGQDQRHHLRTAVRPRQPVDHEREEQCARERRQRERYPSQRRDTGDDEHDCAQRSPARYADQPRLGERIAEDRLQRGAGHAQPRAHADREDDAGHPDAPHHLLAQHVHLDPGRDADAIEEHRRHLQRRHAHRADTGVEQHRDHQQHDQQGERRAGARGSRGACALPQATPPAAGHAPSLRCLPTDHELAPAGVMGGWRQSARPVPRPSADRSRAGIARRSPRRRGCVPPSSAPSRESRAARRSLPRTPVRW